MTSVRSGSIAVTVVTSPPSSKSSAIDMAMGSGVKTGGPSSRLFTWRLNE